MTKRRYEYKRFETEVSMDIPEEESIRLVMDFVNIHGEDGWLFHPPQVFPEHSVNTDLFVIFGAREIDM